MMENIVAVVMVVIGLSVAVFGFWIENSGAKSEKDTKEAESEENTKKKKNK